jgi:metal-sulfur cluster biosynthetic enzyme
MHGLLDERRDEVWRRLGRVTDPELDEPVTELGFIRSVELGPDGGVDIAFRLPTYWCAANFAFLMADDMRREVGALPWVSRVRPRLLDHLHAERINEGVAQGASFRQVFGAEIEDETLETLRLRFLRKAFQRRQEAVLLALIEAGHATSEIVGMEFGYLAALELPSPVWPAKRRRYLETRHRLARTPLADGAPAFVDLDGAPLTAARFESHLQTLRSVRLNMEFNGALCRGLLAAREAPAAGFSREASP